MNPPPFHPVALSLLSVVWWVAIWGLSESILHILFKESVFMRLGVYLVLLGAVLLIVLMNPEYVSYL
jgi:hypothetical protein